MNAHNSLIKPSFTKSVMGYNTGEVDKYVEHVSERYNSVCKENAELKRRLLAEGVRIREAEEKISELEKAKVLPATLDKSALVKIFDSLNAEKERFAYFIESVKERLNEICTDGEELPSDDWEDALSYYIEEVNNVKDTEEADTPSVEFSPSFTADSTDGFYEISDDETDGVSVEVPVSNASVDYDAETDNVLSILESGAVEEEKSEKTFVVPDLEDDVFTLELSEGDSAEEKEEDPDGKDPDSAEDEDGKEETPEDTRTPAQIAADLDFYTDGSHADGESFDPMTLAAQITSRNSRHTFEDFMTIIPSDEN